MATSPNKRGGPSRISEPEPEYQVEVDETAVVADDIDARVAAAVASARAEFEANIADLVAAQVSKALDSVKAGDVAGFDIKALASAIRDMTDEGSSYKVPRLPHAEMERRRTARRSMLQGLADAAADGVLPRYRVRDKVFLDNQIIEPFTVTGPGQISAVVIGWSGEPNLQLEPIGDPAIEIMQNYIISIGATPGRAELGYTEIPNETPHWVTPAGLVIEGSGPELSRRTHPIPDERSINTGALNIRLPDLPPGAIDPRAKSVHILGSILPPAKQNYYGIPGSNPAGTF